MKKFRLEVGTKYAEPGVYDVLREFDEERIIIYLTPRWSELRQLTIVRLADGYILRGGY